MLHSIQYKASYQQYRVVANYPEVGMDNQKKPQEQPRYYDRVLARLLTALESAELRSWDYLQEKIEEAVEVELAAEELTRDEMDLLGAYLKRDLKQLGFYAHETGEGIAAWLNFDLNVLENTLAQQLVKLADQTRIEQERLREQLANADDEYLAGEIAAAGTFVCQACHHALQARETVVLEPCEACGATLYRRQSADWSE